MTNDKNTLLKQMELQRFLPVTEETYRLYDTYNAAIDAHNPDELSCLLFYKGEYFFRIGNFTEALNYLSRCLQAPKHDDYLHFDALSYNIIGLIYTYLCQESIAINNLLQGKAVSESAHLVQEFAICCANIGNAYSQVENFQAAIQYYTLAIEHMDANGCSASKIALLCRIYCCILYCKTHNKELALPAYDKICQLQKQSSPPFFTATIFNLRIRLYDFLGDVSFLRDNLNQLLILEYALDFLDYSSAYFDAFDYLLEKRMQPEAFSLLEYIRNHVSDSSPAFLKQHYLNSKKAYSHIFGDKEEYLQTCHQLIELLPDVLEEQRYAKLCSLDYIEQLRKTKNESEMYRKKSQLDQMTGLLNKHTIQFFVEEDLTTAQSSKQSAMILIDLDHFKQINDTLGHLAGDTFICQTASVIQDYFKEKAFCGRVGGDEFLVYLPEVTDPSFVILQSEFLRQEIYRKTSERNITVTTQASIGIAFSSEYYYDYETMFNAADQALYRAKLGGRNKVVVAGQNTF